MKKSITLSVIAASLAFGSVALAMPNMGKNPEQRFKEIDTNRDGKITASEMKAHRIARFDATDANKDGTVTREEMQAAGKAKMEHKLKERFQALDLNKDGKLTQAEAKNMPPQRFKKLDANGDGVLTEAEMSKGKGHKARGPKNGKWDKNKKNGHGNKARKHGKRGHGPRHGGGMLKHLDSNQDGALQRSEIANAPQMHFQRLDTDKNGVVTLEEFKQGRKGRQHQGRGHGPGKRGGKNNK